MLYADRENGLMLYKVVYNRAGEYWKLVYNDLTPAWSPDGTHRYFDDTVEVAIDDKTDHSGIGTANGTHGNMYEYNTGRVHPQNFAVDQLLKWGK